MKKKYSLFTNKLILIFCIIIIIICLGILSYFSYYKIMKKKIYIGCLYSQTGIVGEESYKNYLLLKESIPYAIKKYNLNIEVELIYKDLGDNLDNYYNWILYCVKKYNIKYFFGCWRSNERKKIIPLLKKYNLRLFYPNQYEGFECINQIYYFGPTINQQLIPGIMYMFSKFSDKKDVYVIGNDYIYPLTSDKIIKDFIKNNESLYHKKYIKSLFIPLNISLEKAKQKVINFVQYILDKSPNGAIIIGLINGMKLNLLFNQLLYDLYYKKYKKLNDNYHYQTNKFLNYIKSNKSTFVDCYEKYPIISLSTIEDLYQKKDLKYFYNNYICQNFTNQILENSNFQLYNGLENVDDETTFLGTYHKKNKMEISGTLYSTFLSALFFAKTMSIILKKNLNIYDVNHYNQEKNIEVLSINGYHALNNNNNITNNFVIAKLNEKNIFNIVYQSYKNISPKVYLVDNQTIDCDVSFKDQIVSIIPNES